MEREKATKKTGFGGRKLSFRLILLLAAAGISSCAGLRGGYLARTSPPETWRGSSHPGADSLLLRTRELKKNLFGEAKSLAAAIEAAPDGKIPAHLLNGLHANLEEHLRLDSQLHLLAARDGNPQALALLLESALGYDSCYRTSKTVRRLLNRGNTSTGLPERFLDDTHRFLLTPFNWKSAGIQPPPRGKKPSPVALAGFMVCRHGDRCRHAGYEWVNRLSKVFGNLAGSVSLKGNPPADPQLLVDYLQPLDIILVKSETHLTDRFIPGFFGHVAVWTGTAAMLEKMGAWDLPTVVPHRVALFEGQIFAEGLRSGVKLSPPELFGDGNLYLVLRPEALGPQEKNRILGRLLSHLGKEYDFNFDLRYSDRIFCSELIYLAFDTFGWETRKTWGRVTLSPDEILTGSPCRPVLKPVVLVTREGILSDPSPEMLRRILEE